MWDVAARLGFTGGRVLEPGCGSGYFLALAPPGADLVGVERDPTTAAIAQALYPDARVHPTAFERFAAPREPFDLVIGNVPFAKVAPHDDRFNRSRHSIHNYFLVKSLHLTRPGGLVVALTSRYTLDARNPGPRREIGQLADLVGAVRLPSGAMRAAAGTEAIEDLLVLRRREPGAPPAGAAWERTVEVPAPDEKTGEPVTVTMNAYFAEHPERVLGTVVSGRGMYRDGELRVLAHRPMVGVGRDSAEQDLEHRVVEALGALAEASPLRWAPPPAPSQPTPVQAQRTPRLGDVELSGSRRVPLRPGSFVTTRTGVLYRYDGGDLLPAAVPKGSTDEVRALIDLRNVVVDLLDLEATDAADDEIEATRAALREGYERYRHRWGPLNRVSWARSGRVDPATGEERRRRVPARLGGFREDPDWPTLSAIEAYDEDTGVASAAAIQRRRMVHPPRQRFGADTAGEALAICLDEQGRVDPARVAELLGVDEDAARAELGGLVFTEPTTRLIVPAEQYLSGNVRAKLAAAREAASDDPVYAANVAALEQVIPEQLTPDQIYARPGAPWIPPSDVEQFVGEVLEAEASVTHTPSLAAWQVRTAESRRTVALTSQWGTSRRGADKLLEASLNQRLAKVYDEGPTGALVLNADETFAAQEKQEQLAARFSEWVWEDPARAGRLAERYNEAFNSYVTPAYDGSHLSFPGLTSTFVPHPHQRNAVARIVREGDCLLAHAVGAGKTATMVMAGMEMRRLGLVNRPAYVIPNHMLEQFSRELLQLHPQARTLVVTKDLTGREGRKRFVARCATGDWDAVVITHSAFERMPLRADTYLAYSDDTLAAVRHDLERARALDNTTSVKRLEEAMERAKARLERLLAESAKDDGVCFEETGIDYLFVDELHLFKNRAVVTSIDGARSAGSKRASDLDAKLWALRRHRPDRVICGATATPIANAVAEAWIMQTYVQPRVLDESGVGRFDPWAATFAQHVAALELAPDGGSYRVQSRLAKYNNVPELLGLFHRGADVLVRDDLKLKLPAIEGGKPATVVVDASPELTGYVESLVGRADAVRNRLVQPNEDNMLTITGDGRKAALDLRLVDEPPDRSGGKVEAAATRIARIHRETRHLTYLDDGGEPSPRPGGFQIVFCDLSTPNDDGSWSVYQELKDRLVAHGVPAGEVAFIHEPRNDEARARLFARCRNGQVAVLVGSTAKMGVGTNIHTRAVALHHLDCPWRPADIEQREGRILRQGNQNDMVQVVRYVTEGSFDIYMWQTVERKAGFIGQVLRGEVSGRDLDDVGEAALSYAEVKALATGNPLVIEQAGVQAELAKLERLAAAHRRDQASLSRTLASASASAEAAGARADQLATALNRRVDTRGDRFAIELGGTTYTDRVEAGNQLLSRARQAIAELSRGRDRRELRPRYLGRLGGFPVHLDGYRLGSAIKTRLTLDYGGGITHVAAHVTPDDLADKLPDRLVGQIEHQVRNLDRHAAEAAAEVEEQRARAAAAEARVGMPFDDQPRLDTLRRRYEQILDQLSDAEPGAGTGLQMG